MNVATQHVVTMLLGEVMGELPAISNSSLELVLAEQAIFTENQKNSLFNQFWVKTNSGSTYHAPHVSNLKPTINSVAWGAWYAPQVPKHKQPLPLSEPFGTAMATHRYNC